MKKPGFSKYHWISPLCTIIAGMLGLMSKNTDPAIKVFWSILMLISCIVLVVGIIDHKKSLSRDLQGNDQND